VFDYMPFPVLTHTTEMTHFQNPVEKSLPEMGIELQFSIS